MLPALRIVPSVVLAVLCAAVALVSLRFLVLGVAGSMEFVAYHANLRPIAFYTHVTLGPLALILLPVQANGWVRRTRPRMHRWLGRISVVAIGCAGVAGFWLAVTTTAGPVASVGFALLALLWLSSTAVAFRAIRSGDVATHRRWMIRSASLTLAGVTLRIWLPLAMVAGLPFDAAYTAIAWLCWVPNLIVAELILRRGVRVALP